MKFKFLIPVLALFFVYSCSVNDDNSSGPSDGQQDVQIFQWHLTNVSGGVAGVDIDFEADTVIWIFNIDFVGSGNLQVENNNTDDTIEDGLNTGTHPVSIPVYDNQSILFVDGNEFGAVVTPTDQDLVINQNIKSTGETGSDGFIYTFKRKIIIESN